MAKQNDNIGVSVLDELNISFDDTLVTYPVELISQLNELTRVIPECFISLHRDNIEKLCEIKHYLNYQRECIDLIVDKCVLDGRLELINRHVYFAHNYSSELHEVVVDVGRIFYHTWMKDYDYEEPFLSFVDKKDRDGDKYINLMSSFIAGFVSNDNNNDYVNLMNLCFSEEIKGNHEASYSICKSVGFILYEQSYAPFRTAGELLNKINKSNSLRLSRASARPKSRYYEEIISIIKLTVRKHEDASVSSLIEKIYDYYNSSQRKPPAKNTIRSWISDIGYKPKGKATNKYQLVVKTEKS